jgi:hypothetical protein
MMNSLRDLQPNRDLFARPGGQSAASFVKNIAMIPRPPRFEIGAGLNEV